MQIAKRNPMRSVACVGLLLVVSWGCAGQKLRLDELQDVQIGDIVHHKILRAVGMKEVEAPQRQLNPQLYRYVQEFVTDAEIRGVTISPLRLERLRIIAYVDKLSKESGPGVVATCNRYEVESSNLKSGASTKWMTIEVLQQEVADFIENEEIRLKMLVYHELFHCLMARGHLPADHPAGIMSATLSKGDASYYEEMWPKLVDDMFANAEVCPQIDD